MDRMKAMRRWQLNLKATAVVSSDHFLWEAAELSALRLLWLLLLLLLAWRQFGRTFDLMAAALTTRPLD